MFQTFLLISVISSHPFFSLAMSSIQIHLKARTQLLLYWLLSLCFGFHLQICPYTS